MKLWLRRIAIGIGILVLIAVLLPLIAIVGLQHDGLRSIAVDRIVGDINEELPGSVDVDRVEGSLLGHARFKDVRITDARGNHAAQIETASVDFRLLPLLSGRFVVDDLTVDGAQVVARTYEDDILNWDLVVEPDPEPGEPLDWSIDVADVSLRNVDLAYLDETADVVDDIEGLATWRRSRIEDLDQATDADELRRRWDEGFAPDNLAPLADPRAPSALWLTALEADGGAFGAEGFDIRADFPTVSGDLHADIFPRSLSLRLDDIAVAVGESSITVDLGDAELDQWMRGRDVALSMVIFPRGEAPPEHHEEKAFESLAVDLGRWHLNQPIFDWAAPDAPVAAPVEASGRLALDLRDLILVAELEHDEATHPVEVTVFLDDYAEDIPEYRAALRAREFHAHHWLDDPELPDVTTSAVALVEGSGLEPDELEADLRLGLEDTTVDGFHADVVYTHLDFDGELLRGHRLAALTPYFDALADFELDLAGRARFRARTTAEEHHENASPQFAKYRPDRADIDIDIDARFDPDLIAGDDPLEAFRSVEASTTWDIAGFDTEDISAGHSAGRLSIDAEHMTGRDEMTIAAFYDVDASARALQFHDQRLGSFSLRDRGKMTFTPRADDPFEAVVDFANDATFRASHVHTPELRLTRADITMETTDRGRSADAADLRWRADLDGLRTDEATISDLDVRLDGILRYDAGRTSLRALEADIRAEAGGISTDDFAVETLTTHLDDSRVVFGDGDPPVRSVSTHLRADASVLSLPEGRAETIDDIDAEIALDFGAGDELEDLLRHFDVDARASIVDIEAPDHDGSIERVDLRADLRGPFDAPEGVIGADASEIAVAEEFFPEATATVELDGDLRRGRAAAEILRGDDEGYHLRADFSFEPSYDAGEVSDVRVGTERMSWRSPDDAVLRWTGERVETDEFLLRHGQRFIAADGYFQPGVDQDIDVATDIDFEELIDGFYLEDLLPKIDGQLQATAHLGGTHDVPTAEAELELDDFHYEGIGPFSASLRANYDDELLWVHRLDVAAFGEDLIEAAGQLPMAVDLDGDVEVFAERRSQLRARLHPQRLRRFHRPFPILNDYGVDGTAEFYLDWAGTLDDPEIEMNAEVHEFRLQGEVAGDFVNVRDMTMNSQLQYLSVRRGGEGLRFSTDVVWEDEDVLDIRLHTEWMLEDWLVAIAEDGPGALEWDDEFLALPFEIRFSLPSFDLGRIPMDGLDDLEGHVEVDAHLHGPLAEPEGHVDLDVEDLGWRRPVTEWNQEFRDIDVDMHLQIDEQTLYFETLDLRWMDRDISSAEGTVPLPIPTLIAGEPLRDLPIDFHWIFHERDIRDFDAIAFDLYGHIVGSVGAELAIDGSLRAPELAARVGIYDTRLGDDRLGSFEVEFSAEDDRVEVDGELTREQIPIVTVGGHAPVLLDIVQLSRGDNWQLPGDIHLDVGADRIELADVLPVDLLSDYVIDPEGVLTVDVDVNGTWEEPTVDGFAELEDGAATLPEFARGFQNINTRVELGARAFVLDHFELHDGPSSVEASGTITHDLLVPDEIDLSAEADNFNLVGIGTDFPVFTSGTVLVTGDILGEPGELRVDVHDLEVVLTDEWDRTLHATDLDPDIVILDEAYRARIAQMVDDEVDEIDGLHLDVDIVVHRPAVAHHPAGIVNFDAELSAEVIGTMVTVGGTVDIVSGELEFLGRRFLLQPSEITFIGDIPPNPRLNIEAHHELERVIVDALGPPRVGEPRIEFHITGTAMEPRLQLEADPAMTDTEILFVLMTGRPPDRTDIGRDEGVAAQALSAVSGVFFGLLEDELAGTVPVDVLRLEPPVAGGRGTRLEVGRYLWPNLYAAWRHQFGTEEDIAGNTWSLEYHFRPRWMLEGRYNDLNEGEFNIFWDAY